MRKATKVCEEALAGRHESAYNLIHFLDANANEFGPNTIQVTRTENLSGDCQ